MRIVAGAWRGRQVKAPPGEKVRPTGDRVREAWMSIVSSHLPEARVLDLFSGSGALGLEALSRGAREAHFVDNAPGSLEVIRHNIAALGAGDRATVHRAEALGFVRALERDAFDVAFADPPYDHGLATAVAKLWVERPFASLLGIEHRQDETLPGSDDRRKYGHSVITFFRAERDASP